METHAEREPSRAFNLTFPKKVRDPVEVARVAHELEVGKNRASQAARTVRDMVALALRNANIDNCEIFECEQMVFGISMLMPLVIRPDAYCVDVIMLDPASRATHHKQRSDGREHRIVGHHLITVSCGFYGSFLVTGSKLNDPAIIRHRYEQNELPKVIVALSEIIRNYR